ALFRYPFVPSRAGKGFLRKPVIERSLIGGSVGAAMAVALSVLVALVFAVRTFEVSPDQRSMLWGDWVSVSGAYLGGHAVAGSVIGALAPIVRWPLGAMSLGIPLTGIVYGSAAIALSRMEFLGADWDPAVFTPAGVLVILTWIGPMWGLMVKEWIEGG
ncbi:MAG: hypothetical protein PVJ80_08055, partial [Gemmatimonadota bacterium]